MQTKRYHIIIDVSEVAPERLTDAEGLKAFLERLPGCIDMHLLTQPLVAQGIPENPGLSGFVIIDYSHISIHTFTANGEVLVDIFSCKPYEQQTAVDEVLEFFKANRNKAHIQVVSWS